MTSIHSPATHCTTVDPLQSAVRETQAGAASAPSTTSPWFDPSSLTSVVDASTVTAPLPPAPEPPLVPPAPLEPDIVVADVVLVLEVVLEVVLVLDVMVEPDVPMVEVDPTDPAAPPEVPAPIASGSSSCTSLPKIALHPIAIAAAAANATKRPRIARITTLPESRPSPGRRRRERSTSCPISR